MNFKYGLEYSNGYRKNLTIEADGEEDACWKTLAVARQEDAKVTYIHHARRSE